MDRYTKGFVVASVVYLFLAATLGVWMGGANTPAWVPFAHVHFNLLGFMAMMVYGVGYFILPRFNARALRWPSWLPVHFYIANVGLVGMVVTSAGRPSGAFGIFAGLSVLSVGMFALNIGVTMLLGPDESEDGDEPEPEEQIHIEPATRVGEILSRWPGAVSVFVENGFASLASPEHQEQVKQMPITLEMACQKHGVDVDMMIRLLTEAASSPNGPTPQPEVKVPLAGMPGQNLSRGDRVTFRHIIGEILKVYPETEPVFKKYYGGACFSCPGQATETIRQSAMMHNVDEKAVLRELNEAAGVPV